MTKVVEFDVDPHAEDAVLAAHHDRPRRAFEHHDHVVAALAADQRIGIVERAENGEVGAAEVGGDRHAVGRQPDLDAFRIGRGLLLRCAADKPDEAISGGDAR